MILALALLHAAHATPVEMVHTGRLIDTTGVPVDGPHSLTLTLYDTETAGTVQWSEQQNTTFDNGYFAVTLGSVSALEDSVLDQATLWLTLAVDSDPETPAIRVASVPYARLAGTATNLSGGVVDASELRVNGNVVIDSSGAFTGSDTLSALACVAGQVPSYSGSAWGCADPYGDSDALLAMGPTGSTNPLNHDRYSDGEAVAALSPHTSDSAAHHTRYADADAQGALLPHTSDAAAHHTRYTDADAQGALLPHTSDAAAHHTRYADADAITAVQGVDLGYAAGSHSHLGDDVLSWVNDPATSATLAAARVSADFAGGGGNMVANGGFAQGMAGWSMWSGSAQVVQGLPDAIAGTSVIANDANQGAWVQSTGMIPVNLQRAYQVRGSFRRTDTSGASGTVYLAVKLMDETGTNLSGDGTWWYYPIAGATLTDTNWHTYTAEFGANTAAPFDRGSGTGTAARFMAAGVILNYPSGDRSYQATDIGIFEVNAAKCKQNPSAPGALGQCIWNTGAYTKTYQQAAAACRSQGGRLCTLAEVSAAQAAGADWCSWGWVADRVDNANAYIAFPIQGTRSGCGSELNTTTNPMTTLRSANCCAQ